MPSKHRLNLPQIYHDAWKWLGRSGQNNNDAHLAGLYAVYNAALAEQREEDAKLCLESWKAAPNTRQYCPLVLKCSTTSSKWELSFQLHPDKRIIFAGDEPTRDEIIACLQHLPFPVLMIEVIESVIGHVLAERQDKKDRE